MTKPVSHVMPKSVIELLEAAKVLSDSVALRLYILGAESDIVAAYAKIAELEATIEGIEHEVSKVYCEITDGKFSKPNTLAVYILDEVEWQLKKELKEIESLKNHNNLLFDELKRQAKANEMLLKDIRILRNAGDELASQVEHNLSHDQINPVLTKLMAKQWHTAALRQSGMKDEQ